MSIDFLNEPVFSVNDMVSFGNELADQMISTDILSRILDTMTLSPEMRKFLRDYLIQLYKKYYKEEEDDYYKDMYEEQEEEKQNENYGPRSLICWFNDV